MRTRCVSLATRGVELIGLFVVVALALPASAQKSSSVDAELSKVEKAVSSLVAQPIKRDMPKVGRNDPCPCGSGKKYKKCHGAAEA